MGKKLVVYLTAGYPDASTTEKLACIVAKAGAEILELGVPFSDPLADGPSIQNASSKALKSGMNLNKVFEIAGRIKTQTKLPIYLMSYYNPVFNYGQEKFLKTCEKFDIKGLIIPDMSLGAEPIFEREAHRRLNLVYLASPNSSDKRLKEVIKASRGFVYIVSILGITGARTQLANETRAFIKKISTFKSKTPKYIGFGISSVQNVASVKKYVDGVIIGSAIIDIISSNPRNIAFKKIALMVAECRKELDK